MSPIKSANKPKFKLQTNINQTNGKKLNQCRQRINESAIPAMAPIASRTLEWVRGKVFWVAKEGKAMPCPTSFQERHSQEVLHNVIIIQWVGEKGTGA